MCGLSGLWTSAKRERAAAVEAFQRLDYMATRQFADCYGAHPPRPAPVQGRVASPPSTDSVVPPPIMQTMVSTTPLPDDYPQLLARLKREIGAARTRAALAVNEELIKLYWRIGREILERQEREGWGAKIIDRLAADLRQEFPTMKGLSARNLKYMRQFAATWPERKIVPQPVAQLPWGHYADIGIRAIFAACSASSTIQLLASGTPRARSSMAGHASCSNTTSPPGAPSEREGR